jgi:DNA mismatch repair protein MutS
MEGFGFDEACSLAIRAAGAILQYLTDTQGGLLELVDSLRPFRADTSMGIDQATWRSLEITRTLRHNRREGSLFDVIDRTVTSMGSRCLGEWLAAPLADADAIHCRLDAVEELVSQSQCRQKLRKCLGQVHDVQRLLARIAAGRSTPRDLAAIARTLGELPAMHRLLSDARCPYLVGLRDGLDLCESLRERLDGTLVAECPLSAREGGLVIGGCNAELDEYRELARGGKQWIAQYQERISRETGIASLKVGFNRVFGYYVEVTHQHRDRLPDGFTRKQTLKNAERFITPELKEYEERVLSAEQNAIELEYRIFCELRDAAMERLPQLKRNAQIIGELDALSGLAELAVTAHYVRPQITDDPLIDIEEGRHPVLDITRPLGAFVPNSTQVGGDGQLIHLITGPNMAGKSTYIRQTALIVLLAHIGSFVPAKSATIGIADRLFARVGASDELARGQSTFMVEMTETARILNTATPRSVVILDEIGRGTSTYDGVSLAWAIVEYIHDRIGCRTLFATHYHELTQLAATLERVANFNVAVREWNDQIVFLHRIEPGAADRSYGIHVARLAGVPNQVNQRAATILAQLEGSRGASAPPLPRGNRRQEIQLTLFDAPPHPLIEKIRRLDTNHVTPMDALQLLRAWHEELHDGGSENAAACSSVESQTG